MSQQTNEQLEGRTMEGLFVLRRISDAGGLERTLLMGIALGDVRSGECIEEAKE